MSLPIIFGVLLLLTPFAIHRVQEGCVGVYFRGGALLDKTTEPGYHFMVPFVDEFTNVQVTMQTDKVQDIPCGTSGGVVIYFDKIEVVNRLKKEYVHDTVKNYTIHYDQIMIFDKIHHEVNQFCSALSLQEVFIDRFDELDEKLIAALQESCNQWAPGIEIIAVRVTKPRIPETVRASFELIAAESSRLNVAIQKQRLVQQEAETERRKATIDAQKLLAVAQIDVEKEIAEKEAERAMSAIEDDIRFTREKAATDAEFYRLQKEAEGQFSMLTPSYMSMAYLKAAASNAQFVLGDQIPAHFIMNGMAGSAEQKMNAADVTMMSENK
eukprot:TRINITY_DN9566_c0_g1_i2.p1 TRINITY_DN9566_c0_g1~~TRINITY_DN9566_c0_g1_i2.p1  ORF type:complete len:326 (+),score=92.54 TRINITY_DN9566_c0_g1_i2:64-1041(+)